MGMAGLSAWEIAATIGYLMVLILGPPSLGFALGWWLRGRKK